MASGTHASYPLPTQNAAVTEKIVFKNNKPEAGMGNKKTCQYLIGNFEKFWKTDSKQESKLQRKDWGDLMPQPGEEEYHKEKKQESPGKCEINEHSWAQGVPSKVQGHLHRRDNWEDEYSGQRGRARMEIATA